MSKWTFKGYPGQK